MIDVSLMQELIEIQLKIENSRIIQKILLILLILILNNRLKFPMV